LRLLPDFDDKARRQGHFAEAFALCLGSNVADPCSALVKVELCYRNVFDCTSRCALVTRRGVRMEYVGLAREMRGSKTNFYRSWQ
jgi:hypothetical protein